MKHHDQVHLGFKLTEERFRAEQYTDLLDDLIDPEATLPSGVKAIEDASPEELQTEFDAISRQVRRVVEAVNESVKTAQESNDINTRKSEIETARAKIAELQLITDRHPSVELERLEEVKLLIEQIDQGTAAL